MNLKEIREAKGMTQEELGKLVGMSRGNVSNIESGRRNPSVGILKKLAAALDCDLEVLFKPKDK